MQDNDPLIGRTLGNYVAEKKLGEGGMGAVYRLRHRQLPNTYQAMKVQRLGGAAGLTERFQQEAHVAAAIGSHRVVRPLDVGQFDDGTAYILMEYVAGRSLREELDAQGPLPIDGALRIAARIADTMVLAHAKGIVHRDLKPANIMLVQEGDKEHGVRLLDFGVARATGALKMAETAERAVIGTPGYMSPEAATGLAVDGRADVFSLAVVLFEMLTREQPFAAPNLAAIMLRLLSETPPPASTRRPKPLGTVPTAVDAVLARAFAKDPAQRYTMAEFHAAIVNVLDARGGVGAKTAMSLLQAGNVDPHDAPTLSSDAAKMGAMLDGYRAAARFADGTKPSFKDVRRRNAILAALALPAFLGGAVVTSRALKKPPQATASTADAGRELPVPSIVAPSIRLSTTPPGAQVFVDGKPLGVTPLSLEHVLPFSAEFKLADHQPRRETIDKAGELLFPLNSVRTMDTRSTTEPKKRTIRAGVTPIRSQPTHPAPVNEPVLPRGVD